MISRNQGTRELTVCVFMVAWLTAACTSRLVGGLEETEAIRVLGVLEEQGIWAGKEKEVRGREVSWEVVVGSESLAAARKILQAAGLPKEKRPGMERLLETGGIIPTAEELSGRKAAAVGEELSAAIETLSGVVEARVLVALPETSAFSSLSEEETVEGTAAVLIRHRGKPSFELGDIQRLVAGAVAGMKAEHVTVVLHKTAQPAAAAKPVPYRKLGPFLVAPSSRSMLLGFLVVLLASNLVLAAIVVTGAFRFLRKRRSRAAESA
jgi:type III secretion system YscJ/HrcJ family lipoprotein